MKFFSTPNTSVPQVPQSPISKSTSLILLPPLFQKISQTPGQNEQNGKGI